MLLWGLRRQRNITTLLMLGHRADQTIPQPGMSVSKVGRGSHPTGLPESLVGSLSCSLCLFIPSALLGTAKLCKLAHNRIQWAAGLGLDPKTIHRRMFTCNIYCSGPMEAQTMSQVHIQSDKGGDLKAKAWVQRAGGLPWALTRPTMAARQVDSRCQWLPESRDVDPVPY